MSPLSARSGVLAAVGPARQADRSAFAACHLRWVRLRAHVNPAADVLRWRDVGATAFILQLLSPLPARRRLSPRAFVDYFSKDIDAFVAAGVDRLEIHEEPNRPDRGMGVSWQDGAAFAAWFAEVARVLRVRFGNNLKIGFPALASAVVTHPDPGAPADEGVFLTSCRQALESADWAALHIYWGTLEEMRAFEGAMRFLRTYLEPFPDLDFIVTAFANTDTGISAHQRGSQYLEFLTCVAQYDRVIGACGFLLRSGDPVHQSLGWLRHDGTPTAVIDVLAGQPALPDPRQVWFVWPTEFRRYDQVFGDHQRDYHERYQISGGHNGVDLAVDETAPEASAVYAAFRGTVVQVALDGDGYGHHVRVRGYGPMGETITLLYAHLSRVEVTMGVVVARGDLLGWAGASYDSVAPHLHLGMRVEDISGPTTGNWLNPRPYLEARPRGLPRESHIRTYVLLPPNADSEWAAAVVAGGWETYRFTFGRCRDDAGIGAFELRRVIAVNPRQWEDDLSTFFETYYPGVQYLPVEAYTPATLRACLASLLPVIPDHALETPIPWPFGLPREAYARTYLLLPPTADASWALAAVQGTWDRIGLTIGGSADDAGVGDLDDRTVIAVNPEAWTDHLPGAEEGSLAEFFENTYPGVSLVPFHAASPKDLVTALGKELDGVSAKTMPKTWASGC